MLEAARTGCHGITVWLVEFSARAAAAVVCIAVIVTAVLLYYTATNLSLNTNTVDMIDPTLPFREQQIEFDRAFPQLDEVIVVVIDGETPERAQSAANALTQRLRQQSKLFESIDQPGQGSFFAHNGLLYLDTDKLHHLAEELASAEPFLATLVQEPSLRALFNIFSRAIDEQPGGSIAAMLGTTFDRISQTIDAQLEGRPHRLSWQEGMLGDVQSGMDANRSFVLAKPRLDFTSLQPGAEALATIRRDIQDLALEGTSGVRVRLTGPAAMDQEDMASVSGSAKIATSLSFTLVCVLLLLGLRYPRLVAWILITLCMGLVWTAAFATATIGYLNLLSVTFAVLFIGLGVDFGIQFGLRYREELARVDKHKDALGRAAGGLCDALLLAATCAAVSFFCFIPTAYQGLAQLGFIAGFSMLIALFATLTVLPALLTLMPIKAKTERALTRSLPAWTNFPIRHPRPIIITTIVLSLGSAALLPFVRFDFNPLNLSDPTTESVQTFRDLLDDPNTTPYTIDILASDLSAAKTQAKRVGALDVVDKTMTLASFVPDDQAEKMAIIDDINLIMMPVFLPATAGLPPSVAEQTSAIERFQEKILTIAHSGEGLSNSASRLAGALERLKAQADWPEPALEDLQTRILGDLPANIAKLSKLLSPKPVSLAELPADLKNRYIADDGRARIVVYPKENVSDNEKLRQFVDSVLEVAPMATGAPVTLVESGMVVMGACVQATLSAIVAVCVLLTVVLRSIWTALLILLPLVFALLLTVAMSVIFDLPFNFANVIALPLLLGIGVAFGIYLVTRKLGGISVGALLRSSTPRAVLYSGLTTMASFGTLALSQHRGMSGMGLLVTFALSFALLASLVIVPAIMTAIDELGAHRRARAGASGDSAVAPRAPQPSPREKEAESR